MWEICIYNLYPSYMKHFYSDLKYLVDIIIYIISIKYFIYAYRCYDKITLYNIL